MLVLLYLQTFFTVSEWMNLVFIQNSSIGVYCWFRKKKRIRIVIIFIHFIPAKKAASLAKKTLKASKRFPKEFLFCNGAKLMSQLFHCLYVSHLMHNCAMKVRTYFGEVDKLIATVKHLRSKKRERLI